MLAEALHPSRLAEWLVPDDAQRARVLAAVAAIWVEHAMFYGEVHLVDDLSAASVCFRRYGPLPPPGDYAARLAEAAGPHVHRFAAVHDLLAAAQPDEAHHHLAYLAVHPQCQGTGRGQALMAELHSRIDHLTMPCWTVTLAAGQRLLAHNGYEPGNAITVADGLTLHPMRRPAHRDTTTSGAWPVRAPTADRQPGRAVERP
ncbi:N-acetyltransferase [Micromonospora craniellae]|uniref:N-acetyltransferase n=1 Tax=Micromonospora craniellae TaxID=2294034 RepID=A0A372FSA4_9ACTN|nr:GNAT family N-acetyltransferase [Micromonospora craniellae]RFS43631.1 N-acetyltransferase [Micromonospora craniellae]